ncbi:MAG: TIGR03960 family B12-binding radical SAM protein [Candidatus Cloacimonetes bacterium]|nr:TIGR03960 family B12-binding radical SAM protein [Candidatus Cloacimonadota bacterium]MCF7814307.1 TIGR03960 family B12-binding radical SAM protein [Candidatus Cloacimonadota bacterium]MCF7868384.1 TIGR03960 family B12-binding radical SAM protein [Candidatus Cloacimonadota bacterium]MCF7883851.1 TIGR03960 family B12-binding radical SAM protein [Candidatus Cloacimonadota bacterium]
MKYNKIHFSHLLPSVLKPARYINQELNSFNKEPKDETVNFCLAFPDVYEVGFSHLGLKILYSILNREKDSMADRVYCPWPDFGKLLQSENLPLFGIETSVALKDFDVIGFTLQSELTFTNVLYMLKLSQIPLKSENRIESDPIIIAGGPCASNPIPMSQFIDAFLIGDGEEAILEIKDCLKQKKNNSRKEKLEALQKIEGVFVPALHKQGTRIKARKFMDFDNPDKMHTDQLVPWVMPTHYRYVSEIMRGCSRGCRFCAAGYFYRPVRERDAKKLAENLIKEVNKYGWQEAALTSLSSSDYSCIKPLLQEIYNNMEKASLSLPSLRADSIDDELTTLMNAMRQTGLTVAPEAGSQRLRNIINKNITEEEILESVEIALNNGWKVIKFYFMIGLPHETDDDIQAIIDLIFKITQISRKKLQINITISPFVPKPFTPFQWAKMENRDELIRKAKWIKNAFSKYRFIKIKYHEVDSSLLECVIGRGDKKVGDLILQAYRNGAFYDGWNEYFDFAKWQQAADEIDLNWDEYTKQILLDSELIWQDIDLGISQKFLKQEWQLAEKQNTLSDCRDGNCTGCGLCVDEIQPKYTKPLESKPITLREKIHDSRPNIYYRAFFSKMDKLSYVTNLDLVRMIYNVFRATDLPISYSQGYNVHPMVSFGPPLSLGVQGKNEYFDFVMKELTDTEYLFDTLNKSMPKALQLKDIVLLTDKKMRAMEYYKFEEVTVKPPADYFDKFQTITAEFQEATEFFFTRIRKKREQTKDLKALIKTIEWNGVQLSVVKTVVGASIFDVLDHVYQIDRHETNRFEIVRERLVVDIQP